MMKMWGWTIEIRSNRYRHRVICYGIDTMKGNIQQEYSLMTLLVRSRFDQTYSVWYLS